MTTALPPRVAVQADIMSRMLDDEMVILNLTDGSYYGLDDVGARVWQLLTDTADVETAVHALSLEYDVDEDLLRADVAALLTKLFDAHLMEPVA